LPGQELQRLFFPELPVQGSGGALD